MRSIFVRIYMGMFLAMIAIMLVIAVCGYYISKHRICNHVQENYGGTFRLISEGAARHQGEKQALWLSAIEKISDLSFERRNISSSPLSGKLYQQLQRDQYVFSINPLLSGGQVLIKLADKEHYLVVKLADFGSSLVRTSAFLMLNELGRHKSEQRLQALDNIRSMFNYPIQLKTLKKLHLPSTNIRTIEKRDISVVLKNSTTSVPALQAYAPLGNSPYVLVLGDIPFFEWFPLSLLLFAIIAILALMALSSYLLVSPLEQRLASIDKQIELIGHDKELSMPAPLGSDAIGKLSNTVNTMAQRIHKLIDAQTEMIGAISHELRSPVTRIRFRTAAIEDLQNPVLSKQVSGIEKDLDELESLIDEVLTFSKLKQDLPDLDLESISAGEFFAQLDHKLKISNPDITVTYPANTCGTFFADRRYLHRAIENLINNALKYATDKVEIGYDFCGQQQKIWVSDNGPGIPEKDRHSIFEPFKRLDASRDRQSGGYGLGLAIVKQIAHWHTGEIHVADNCSGGAKLLFSWPRKPNAGK
ncbi:two-component sensor histidine kinase [Thalassomonas viridans]|uniref:histidine kinase n=1 Tax=Thalassomonas viridans TaxID=137584 RepID=A0AAF0C6D9_9GAMM|nr:ATP-binding protein [Thalassomonas viridans]WDE04257.1 two-component sensor histidine kinase [Thalassomonas viridans]